MSRPAAAMMAAAVLLLAAVAVAAAPARPRRVFDPRGPSYIHVANSAQADLFRQITGALVYASSALVQNRTVPDDVVMASSAPPNVTAAEVSSMFGQVLAAATLDQAALATLGDPKRFYYAGRYALYRKPSGYVKGTCVFIHGCKHGPESWFYKSDRCSECTGLPEEVAHSKGCLARGYAVLALASRDREYKSRCFSSSGDPDRTDQPEARQAIKDWTRQEGLSRKPIFMWGVSAGASFAIKFPIGNKEVPLAGLISEVNMPWEDAWGATDGNKVLKDRSLWPPVAYYYMQNDRQTELQVDAAIRIFDRNSIPAQKVYSPPWIVDKPFFSDRSMYITPAQSATIVAALRKIRIPAVDDKGKTIVGPNGNPLRFPLLWGNGYVRLDPRFNRGWINQLRKLLPWLKDDSRYYNLISDESSIWQSLNLAYSQHEIVGEYVRPTLLWLESRGTLDLNALVEQYSIAGKLRCLTEWKEGVSSTC